MKKLEEKNIRKNDRQDLDHEPTVGDAALGTRMTKEKIVFLFNEALEITQIDLSLMN
jgi:hypothetical protein